MVMLALTYPGYQPPYQPLSVHRPGYYFDNFYNDAYLQEPYYPEPFYRPNLYSSYNGFNNYRDTMYNPYNTKPYNVVRAPLWGWQHGTLTRAERQSRLRPPQQPASAPPAHRPVARCAWR